MYEDYGPEVFEYEIQPYDTLSDLADRYCLTEEEIIDVNPEVDFDALYVGQIINIPEEAYDEMLEQQPPPREPMRPGRPTDRRDRFDRFDRYDRRRFQCRGTQYRVRPGDSVYRIARRFNIPIRNLMNANRHINFNYPLEVGDLICIP